MPFILETQNLTKKIIFDDKNIELKIRSIVCDAPARNSCLATKSHNGYFGCGRCTQEGSYINHRMTFPVINAPKRSNISFRTKSQIEHHLDGIDSAFLELDIDLISGFVLDYLHTVCLGVVKKIIGMWLSGELSNRLPSNSVEILPKRLLRI